jgi:hypothetical protein
MLTEIAVMGVLVIAANILLRPTLRRFRAPGWAVRLRSRPRVLIRVWTLALIVMVVLWFVGEQRGLLNGLLLLLWVGVPLAALRLTAFLFRRGPHPPR